MILHYIIVDNGDGSASVRFYRTREEADKAAEIEKQEYGAVLLSLYALWSLPRPAAPRSSPSPTRSGPPRPRAARGIPVLSDYAAVTEDTDNPNFYSNNEDD